MRTILQRTREEPIATILYCRVSTAEQNLDHQLDQAMAAGFQIDEVIADNGVSGIGTRLRDRPEGRRLFDKLRSGDTLVVRWVDRLGRNYEDVTDCIRTFMGMGVLIETVINRMRFDGATKDPIQMAVRDALIGFMAATAQAQTEATKSAQKAGIEAAKRTGSKYNGRKPSYDRATLNRVTEYLDLGTNISTIARNAGLSRQAVLRIRDNPEEAERALSRWGM